MGPCRFILRAENLLNARCQGKGAGRGKQQAITIY